MWGRQERRWAAESLDRCHHLLQRCRAVEKQLPELAFHAVLINLVYLDRVLDPHRLHGVDIARVDEILPRRLELLELAQRFSVDGAVPELGGRRSCCPCGAQ